MIKKTEQKKECVGLDRKEIITPILSFGKFYKLNLFLNYNGR